MNIQFDVFFFTIFQDIFPILNSNLKPGLKKSMSCYIYFHENLQGKQTSLNSTQRPLGGKIFLHVVPAAVVGRALSVL